MSENGPKHNRNSLISVPKLTKFCTHSAKQNIQISNSRRGLHLSRPEGDGKSERVEGQETRHIADGKTGYLFSATEISVQKTW